tara:strand:- start:3482 stop:4084 length:603 start_codon:yes stop_codon:yes gene_type:complete
MLRKIKLYGHLREHTGLKEVEAYVDSVREAVNFLTCNWPKLKAEILQNKYHVLVDKDEIGEEELLYPIGNSSISFIPVVEGSGRFGKILLGAALIGGAFLFNPALTLGSFTGASGATAFGSLGFATKAAVGIGASLVLSGVADLLTPTPTVPEGEQTPESSSFSSPLNVSIAGLPVPLVYGTAICGSIVINTSLEIGDVK